MSGYALAGMWLVGFAALLCTPLAVTWALAAMRGRR